MMKRGALRLLGLGLLAGGVGGADHKLWELGADVNDNPITVFTMFTFTVMLSIVIETIKHTTEHHTHDPHRKLALGAVYSELMMIGVVSFLLILAAEVGLTDLTIRKPGCTSDNSASGSGSTAATHTRFGVILGDGHSGSGSSDPCVLSFDVLMFEYAHLVLFFMGITYAIFIQFAYWQRNRLCRDLTEIQKQPLTDVCSPEFKVPSLIGIMGFGDRSSWIVTLLCLRAGMIINLQDRITEVCSEDELQLEVRLALMKGGPPPRGRAPSKDALHYFDIAKLSNIAVADVLVELLHVPAVVWVAVIVMSAVNLIHLAGVSLSVTVLIFAFFGPAVALFLLMRMATQLQQIVKNIAGHPDLNRYPFIYATGRNGEAGPVPPIGTKIHINSILAAPGLHWSQGGDDAWSSLTGCCDDDHPLNFLDMNDPGSLEIQIQVIIFATCFFVGQITMLSTLIFEELGIFALFVCWVLPWLPLIWFIPRCLVLYVFTHRTKDAKREWLVESVCLLTSAQNRKHLKHLKDEDKEEYLEVLLELSEFPNTQPKEDENPTMSDLGELSETRNEGDEKSDWQVPAYSQAQGPWGSPSSSPTMSFSPAFPKQGQPLGSSASRSASPVLFQPPRPRNSRRTSKQLGPLVVDMANGVYVEADATTSPTTEYSAVPMYPGNGSMSSRSQRPGPEGPGLGGSAAGLPNWKPSNRSFRRHSGSSEQQREPAPAEYRDRPVRYRAPAAAAGGGSHSGSPRGGSRRGSLGDGLILNGGEYPSSPQRYAPGPLPPGANIHSLSSMSETGTEDDPYYKAALDRA